MNSRLATHKRITISDVAKRAGVSVGTVSSVINKKPVSAESLLIVQQAMQQLGYKPNSVAQSMRTNTTHVVGLVVNDISNSLFSAIAKGAEQVLREKGYFLLIGNTNNDPVRERVIVESLIQRRVDGLLIAVADETDRNTNRVLRSVEFPITLLDREIEFKIDSVCDDHASGMRKALRYLFDLGHVHIALITGSNNVRPGRERAAGFRKAFEERGIAPNDAWIRQDRLDALYGYEQAFEILSNPIRPSALVAGGNQIFAGVLRAIRELGLNVPRDLSLVSCDDIDLTQLMNPPITVVARDTTRIGTVAGELLLRRLSGDRSGDAYTYTIQTELIVRDSCAPVE